jgi:hypothetical protein
VGGLSTNTDDGRGIIGDVPVVEAGKSDKLGGNMVGFVLGGLREDGREEWTPSNWSYGMTMRRGRMVSLIASRLSLVGFPSRGGKVS